MEVQISSRIQKFDGFLDDVDYIRVLLYLDEYNPDVLLEDLSRNLEIDNKKTIKIVSALIETGYVKKENNMYQLSEFGKITTKNLKNL